MNPPRQRSVVPPVNGSGRRHELRSDGIRHHLIDDTDDLLTIFQAKMPSHHFADRIELVGTTGAPERRADSVLVQHPAEREVDDSFAEVVARESIETLDRLQVSAVPRRLELGVGATEIVAVENRPGVHAPTQQAAAYRAVHES